jgi:hypothetical protein
MPTEEPSFFTKPLPESDEIPKLKKPTRKKITRSVKNPTKTAEATKQTKISKQLTEIYQDEEGHLPDMKKIKIKTKRSIFATFFGLLLFCGVLAAVAWIGLFFMPGNKKFSQDQVVLRLNGPTSLTAGTTTTYKIIYENNQGTALKKALLNVQYPEGFIFISSNIEAKNNGHTEWDLGEMPAGKKRELEITGITYGSINQKQSWRVFLTYQPENFASDLQKSAILDVTTEKSPFSITVNGTNKTLAGNNSEYTITVKKETQSNISKLEIKPSWPAAFVLASSTPSLNKDLKWILEPNTSQGTSTAPVDTWIFKITGRFTSTSNTPDAATTGEISAAILTAVSNKTITLADSKITTELSTNNLNFGLAINGSLSNFSLQPGGDLAMTVTLKNQSGGAITNATLTLGLNGPAVQKQTLLNWAKIEDAYDGDIKGTQINNSLRRGEITWNKSKIPALAKISKGQEITIDVKLPLKDAQTFNNLSELGTSTQIIASADMRYVDENNTNQTMTSNQIVVTVNSDLAFEARHTISAENGAKHQINWVLTNNFHPLKNITLVADVYGDVTVEIPPTPAGEANYNPATKKITWNIPDMPESIDVLALPITITINKANPTQASLVSKVHIQAQDTVTGEKLDFMGEEVTLGQ